MQNEANIYLEALLTGDSNKIQHIYIKSFPKVRKFVLQNNGQQQDAEDVFQKALMQLSIRYQREKFIIKTNFEAYLFTACKNLWRRELNKSKNKVTNYQVIELEDDSNDMALSILEQKRWELFQESLKNISENCQQILKLFFAKVAYSDIVKKMKYNTETVARQRVFKCKKKLKEAVLKDSRFNSLKEL